MATRLAAGHIPPSGIPLVRCVCGAAVFALFATGVAACAFLGVAANQLLFIAGLAHSTAVNASVGSTIPVFKRTPSTA